MDNPKVDICGKLSSSFVTENTSLTYAQDNDQGVFGGLYIGDSNSAATPQNAVRH